VAGGGGAGESVVIARAYHRGARVRGLIELPFGAALAGEHTCPRVVAARSEIVVAHRGDTEEARAVGAVELDMPRRVFAVLSEVRREADALDGLTGATRRAVDAA